MARKKGTQKHCTMIFFSGLLTLYMFTSLLHRTHSTFAQNKPCFLVSLYTRHVSLANVTDLTDPVGVSG